jgi:hypothetical protein
MNACARAWQIAALLLWMAGPIPAGAFEYAGVWWRGTFSGDDSGTWEARVDTEGTVTGSGVSEQAGNFLFSGWVSESGDLRAIATGPVSTGAEYQGAANSNGRTSGTWVNPGAGQRGTFAGRRTRDVALRPECRNRYRAGVEIPAGYGAAYDVLLDDKPLLVRATGCSGSEVVLTVGRGSPAQLIYRFGYEWRGNQWLPITLRGARFEGDWIVGTANVPLQRSSDELAGLNYVVAHVCTRAGSEWKCGCRDAACDGSFWQLQAFSRWKRR